MDYAALIAKAQEMTFSEALDKFPPTVTVVDWGNNTRGQGKRRGGMVMGAMSAAPRGIKRYTNVFGGLPDFEQHREELGMLPDFGAVRSIYMRGRAVGLNHDQAMLLAYAQQSEITFEQALELMPANEGK